MSVHVGGFLHTGMSGFDKRNNDKMKRIFMISQNVFIEDKIDLFDIPAKRKQDTNSPLGDQDMTLLREVTGRLGGETEGCRPDMSSMMTFTFDWLTIEKPHLRGQ